jgi:hypothetical protein
VVLEAVAPSCPWLLSAGGSLLLEAEEEEMLLQALCPAAPHHRPSPISRVAHR